MRLLVVRVGALLVLGSATAPAFCGGRWLFTRARLFLTARPGGGQPLGPIAMCHV